MSEGDRPLPGDEPIQVSTRDDDELRDRLGGWLATRLGDGTGTAAAITAFDRPQGNGMSSDTVLFDASWTEAGEPARGSFVARLAPSGDAFPVFPTYDLEAQARVMRLVGERTAVPVPTVRWFEGSADNLGTPFLVMDRVDGQVPPDVMPYPMGSWVSEATDTERDALQAASVELLAGIHGIEATPDELAFLDPGGPGATPLRRHLDAERAYYRWVCDGLDTPLLDRAFAWLDDHWPEDADAADPVLSWGDARIGNVIYQGVTPVGVLDWEMASLGPREIDLGWMIFLHRFFQDMAEDFGMAGLPTFFAPAAVAETYAAASGHAPRDLDWFITYAATRHGVIMTRVMGRQVHFGERDMPDDPEEFILHRAALERLLDGTYWPRPEGRGP
jgi:aminoglycoside phosphotransferase (APT) family kinase protein